MASTSYEIFATESTVTENSTPAEIYVYEQDRYSRAIVNIGEGRFESDDFVFDILTNDNGPERISKLGLTRMKYFLDSEKEQEEAFAWLYPNNDISNPVDMKNKIILAISDVKGDYWNEKVQQLNHNEIQELPSHDYFADVDDPHGHLADMLSESVLNQYVNDQVPDHILRLKVGDIIYSFTECKEEIPWSKCILL